MSVDLSSTTIMNIRTWSDTNDETTNNSPTPNRSSSEPEQTIKHSLPSPSQFSWSAQELAENLDAPQEHDVLSDESIFARYQRDTKIRSLLGEGSETAYFYDEGDTIFTKSLGSSAVYGYDGSSLNKISEDFFTLIKAGDYYVVETFGTPEQRKFFVLDKQGNLVQQVSGDLSYEEDNACYRETKADDGTCSFYNDSLELLIEDIPLYSSLVDYDDQSVLLKKNSGDSDSLIYAMPRGARSVNFGSLQPLTEEELEHHNLYQSYLKKKKKTHSGAELMNQEPPFTINIDPKTGVVQNVLTQDGETIFEKDNQDRILDDRKKYLSPIGRVAKMRLQNGILWFYNKTDLSHVMLLNLYTWKTAEIEESTAHFIHGKSVQNFVNSEEADIYDASFTKLGRQVSKEKYENTVLPYTEYVTDSGKHQVINKHTWDISWSFDRILARYSSRKNEIYPFSDRRRRNDHDAVILIVENDGKEETIVLPTETKIPCRLYSEDR